MAGVRWLPALVLLSLTGAAACGSDDRQGDSSLSLTVTSVEYGFVARAFGSALPVAVVELSIRNDSPSGDVYVSRGQLRARTAAGSGLRATSPRGVAICHDPDYAEPELAAVSLPPRGEFSGNLVFALPDSATRLEALVWRPADGIEHEIPLHGETAAC